MSATRTRKTDVTRPRTTPTLLNLLVALKQAGRATAKDLNSNAIYMARLQDAELVKVVDTVKTGRRGRPAHIYAPTKKGHDRARRAVKNS